MDCPEDGPQVHGVLDSLILRAMHGALCLLLRVQKCCLATMILPALRTAAAVELTIEFESEILIFQLPRVIDS